VFGGDNSPWYARQQVERSLKKLGIESIDLYYIHRLDGKTPIETVVGALKELKELVYPPSIKRASRIRPMLIMRNQRGQDQSDWHLRVLGRLDSTCLQSRPH